MAELSAWVIDDIFTLIGRKDKNCLPSGRTSCAFTFSIIMYKYTYISLIYINTYIYIYLPNDLANISQDG